MPALSRSPRISLSRPERIDALSSGNSSGSADYQAATVEAKREAERAAIAARVRRGSRGGFGGRPAGCRRIGRLVDQEYRLAQQQAEELQTPAGVTHYLRNVCGYQVPSSALLAPRTRDFVAAIKRFVKRARIDLIQFQRSNYYYVYAVEEDFGPFFIKFCSYFPFNAKLCLNGHEYLKRQLARTGIAFEALDNGILTCADPERMQQLSSGLTAARIDAVLRKWLGLLPHPFSSADRGAGLLYQVSILQAEFSLTQVLDRPLHGRAFFEDVIRENLDLGRPDQVQLIFGRRVNKRTPSRFRTRVPPLPSLLRMNSGARGSTWRLSGCTMAACRMS